MDGWELQSVVNPASRLSWADHDAKFQEQKQQHGGLSDCVAPICPPLGYLWPP